MTSRERLLAVLRGEIPDRVPVSCYELVGFNSADFCNRQPSYKSLMDYIREKTDCVCMWNPGSDERYAASAFQPDAESSWEDTSDGGISKLSLRVGGRTLTRQGRIINGINTWWETEHLCKDISNVDAYMSIPFDPVRYDGSDAARITSELGDHGILMPSLSDPAYTAMSLMEFGESMVWVMTETEHFAEVTKELHRRKMINLRAMLESTPGDIYRICGPEYICPPYLPPKYFERFMLPYLTDMVDLIHEYGRMVRIHCHGRIGQVIDMISETGCDATDPCEEPPDGDITLKELKARVGGRMTLFGPMQLKLLENGSPDEVRRETKRMMRDGKEGGRFVIMPTASPINVPLRAKTEENYRVYIDTALEEADY